MLSPVYTKLEKKDVEICRAFQNLIKQGKFEIKGDAITHCGSLFKWFLELDKRIEKTLEAPPPETIRKDLDGVEESSGS
jgi:hypothetical protein